MNATESSEDPEVPTSVPSGSPSDLHPTAGTGRVTSSELAVLLDRLAVDQTVDVWLYREGAKTSEIRQAIPAFWSGDQLEALWLMRLFCGSFELFARRRNATDEWQYRLVRFSDKSSSLIRESQIRLLGQSTGTCDHSTDGLDLTEFRQKPNRYPRAKLLYPLSAPAESMLSISVRYLDPGDGIEIGCWTGLNLVASSVIQGAPRQTPIAQQTTNISDEGVVL